MINYRCTRQEGEEMSGTSARIMNNVWEQREEDQPEDEEEPESNFLFFMS